MLSSKSFRLRASLIRGFRNVTYNVEKIIEAKNFSPEDLTTVSDGNWSKQELWMGAKLVSQFNFITAFELQLKLLLSITKDGVGHTHNLAKLYDALREDEKGKRMELAQMLETLFSNDVLAPGLALGRASPTGTASNPRKEVLVNNLRDFCEYCDREAEFMTNRYAYEKVETNDYLHFIGDMGGLVTFLDNVGQFTAQCWKERQS